LVHARWRAMAYSHSFRILIISRRSASGTFSSFRFEKRSTLASGKDAIRWDSLALVSRSKEPSWKKPSGAPFL
jgi:hypothetical protein